MESDVVHEQLVMPHVVVGMIVACLGDCPLPVTIFAALASMVLYRQASSCTVDGAGLLEEIVAWDRVELSPCPELPLGDQP